MGLNYTSELYMNKRKISHFVQE